MILLLDAYNIIRHLFAYKEAEAGARRDWFVRRMARYLAAKRGAVTQIIVVFDGGLFGHRQREIIGGVVQVFAGRGHSADDVLVEYAHKYGNQAVVVTNDRELQARCTTQHAVVMPVREFDQLVEEVLARASDSVRDAESETTYGTITVQKYQHEDEASDFALDELMHAGSMQVVHKPEVERKERSQGGGTKKERRHRQLKKRLGK